MEQHTKKQTAVEFLEKEITQIISYLEEDGDYAMKGAKDKLFGEKNIIQQAKEMEKYQTLDAFVEGSRFKPDVNQSTPDGIEPEVMGAVDYYDDTYGITTKNK